MSGLASSGSGLMKFVKPRMRPQAIDVQAAAMWGIAAGSTALWIVQPFNWIRKTFLEKPVTDAN